MWVFITADNKVYDATDVASLSLFGNAVANGALLTSGTATFDIRMRVPEKRVSTAAKASRSAVLRSSYSQPPEQQLPM